MDSAPHQELGVSAPAPPGHRAGNRSRSQGKCFARFRSESTQENSDGSRDTPLVFKMRFGGWVGFFSYNYLKVQQSQTLREDAQPSGQAKLPCSSPAPGGQLGFSGMDALRKQLAKPKY